jgi:hypothetical protein
VAGVPSSPPPFPEKLNPPGVIRSEVADLFLKVAGVDAVAPKLNPLVLV